jgi:hypothetical protein
MPQVYLITLIDIICYWMYKICYLYNIFGTASLLNSTSLLDCVCTSFAEIYSSLSEE